MEVDGENARVSEEGPGMADKETFGETKGMMKWQNVGVRTKWPSGRHPR